MGRAPDAYKMSHKARGIFGIFEYRESSIPSLYEAKSFSLIGMGKKQDLAPLNNLCSG